jgi:hypothetical protein
MLSVTDNSQGDGDIEHVGTPSPNSETKASDASVPQASVIDFQALPYWFYPVKPRI